ncbi:nucleotide exchange factor GrpE [Haploplasma axanthum]|uniref:Protein GrpE n=1 Tax=Haploplasma axanthum TaxID=29552 RepID=A0A449BF22_HAPAX|nr:nucleotide exchange factor GrpE [Haploplasma axanthum]VEU80900.1 heat shock protein GrpE [Haploplasma axanthum]
MDEKDINNKEEIDLNETKVKEETKEDKKQAKKHKKDNLEIEKLTEEVKLYKESYLKSLAELENFKKRMNEEKIRDRKYAASNLITDLLMPLDQLKKVVEMETTDDKLKNFLIGFKMINDKIFDVLKDDGLNEIKSLNEKFDPNYHYAVEKENNKEKENGIVIEVIQNGYMYKDRILRPAMVKVNEWSENNNE